MRARQLWTRILGLDGYRVTHVGIKTAEETAGLYIDIEPRGIRRYRCSGCSRRTGRVRSVKTRTWDDLPWGAHRVKLRYRLRRLNCRRCGIRTERIGFADPKARVTRRLRRADRLGLSIDAGQPCGGAARSQLGKSSPSRIRIPEGVGVTTDQNAVHGTWVRTKSNEERDNITGPCFPTWSMAK